jgi:hypothetical protein
MFMVMLSLMLILMVCSHTIVQGREFDNGLWARVQNFVMCYGPERMTWAHENPSSASFPVCCILKYSASCVSSASD